MIQPFNPSAPANPNDRKKTGTGFTNLNRIMSANQGNRLGQAVGGGVVQQANSARNDLNQSRTDFNQQAQTNRLDSDENKTKVAQTLDKTNAGEAVGDSEIQDFSRFRAGKYGGPQNLGNENQVLNEAQQAQNLGSLSGTAGGRQALLQRFVGGAGYSQGKQRLDSLLLGQSGGQDLRDARRTTQGLGQEANNAADTARQQGQYFSNQAQDFGKNVVNQLTGSQGNLATGLKSAEDEAAQYQTNSKAALADVLSGKTQITPEEEAYLKQNLGIDQKAKLFGLDVNSYINNADINDSTIANSNQYNTAQNLQKLFGDSSNEAQSAFFNQFNDPTKAGQFATKGPFNYDQTKLSADLADRNQIYQNELKRQGTGEQFLNADKYLQQATGLGKTTFDALSNYNTEKAIAGGDENSPNVVAAKQAYDQAVSANQTALQDESFKKSLGLFNSLQGAGNWENIDKSTKDLVNLLQNGQLGGGWGITPLNEYHAQNLPGSYVAGKFTPADQDANSGTQASWQGQQFLRDLSEMNSTSDRQGKVAALNKVMKAYNAGDTLAARQQPQGGPILSGPQVGNAATQGNQGTAADPEQQAKIAALQRLLGLGQ